MSTSQVLMELGCLFGILVAGVFYVVAPTKWGKLLASLVAFEVVTAISGDFLIRKHAQGGIVMLSSVILLCILSAILYRIAYEEVHREVAEVRERAQKKPRSKKKRIPPFKGRPGRKWTARGRS